MSSYATLRKFQGLLTQTALREALREALTAPDVPSRKLRAARMRLKSPEKPFHRGPPTVEKHFD